MMSRCMEFFFFFSSRRRHTRFDCDWSSDVCSSDLHHVFDDGKARNPSDKFYAFVVPDNGPVAYHAPVVAVPFEDPVIDMAILEVAPPASYRLSAVPVTFARPRDGSHVLTYGFPSPTIAAASVDQDGNWLRRRLFL